jgi:hypothetical protein
MIRSPEKSTIEVARGALSAPQAAPARAYFVENLLLPGSNYFLVIFGDAERDIGIAAVAADSDELLSMAHLPGNTSHHLISEDAARDVLGVGRDAPADLVWLPGPATKSMFYPVWRISTDAGPRYVDQGKQVHETIEPKMERGGHRQR